jgi:predicted NAD/FAD-binding protein
VRENALSCLIGKLCECSWSSDLHFTAANFINFLNNLNIATEPTNMALGVSRDHGLFEWAGKSLASVFCQGKNLYSLQMWRMLFDIIRFYQFALYVLINAEDKESSNSQDMASTMGGTETIGEYLDRHGYSQAFRDGYLIPITAAVWSTSPDKCINEFPVLTLIRFL